MTDELAVILGDAVAGTVTRRSDGRLSFDYEDAYRALDSPTPLSVSMPVEVRSHADRVVTPWLWGLLPDNDAVLRRWAREFHASASSPFSLLATPIGHDCAGAVRFAAAKDLSEILDRPGEVEWLSVKAVANRLRDLREDSTSWLGSDFTGQFSLAGTQAKTALLRRGRKWGVPSGSTATSHILKPAVAGLDDHHVNEHLCLDAARRAGVLTAETALGSFEDVTAVVVTRYDRRRKGDTLGRVHQEDICQALGVHPAQKYQNAGGPGPGQIARLLRDTMPGRAAENAVWRFLDALAWNWLIAGTDAHAKNYSLLLSGPEIRLAPLYDVASALPYAAHERKLRFAMKLGGDYRVFLHENRWPRVADELALDKVRLLDRVEALALRAADAFADAASAAEVQALGRDLPPRLTERVADRAHRCLKTLRTRSAT